MTAARCIIAAWFLAAFAIASQMICCLPPATVDTVLMTVEEVACLARHRAEGPEAAILACSVPKAKAGVAREYLAGKTVGVQLGDGGR